MAEEIPDKSLASEALEADSDTPEESVVEPIAPKPLNRTNQRLSQLYGSVGSHSEQFCNPSLIANNRQLEADNATDIAAHWAVPWSDLMMVMFVMFALMFAMQVAEQDIQKMFIEDANPPSNLEKIADALRKKEPVPEPYPEPHTEIEIQGMNPQGVSPQQILEDSQRIIAEAKIENIDVVLTKNKAVEVTVSGPMLFDLGKADLKPAMQQFLDSLAEVIAKNNYLVEVVGHTDNFPISTLSYPTNWELSSARAARVARYLIATGKLNPARFTIIGQSMYRPSVPQTSLANKAKNRRVAIIITPVEYKP